jgi:ABC-type enterochelin transport system substrate-binding protein
MKKYTFILAIFATVALTACGSGSTTTETTDSTAVSVDTTAAVVDSASVETQTGGSATEAQPVK